MTQVDPSSVAIQGIDGDELAVASQGYVIGGPLSGSQIRNRIITRGFGPSRGKAGRVGPPTQGYGGPSSFIVNVIRRNLGVRRIYGGSGKERLERLYPIVVWAKLISVNEMLPKAHIEGTTTVSTVTEKRIVAEAGFIRSRIAKVTDAIRIVIKRLV